MLATDAITVSPYTQQDLPELRALHALSFHRLAAGQHSAEQMYAHARFIHDDAYGEDVARCNLQCARDDAGRLVATAGWISMSNAPDTARIRKVFVHPDLAGTGLGRRMVGLAEDLAQVAGCADYFVRANINAKGFYKRLGYSEVKPGVMDIGGGVNLPVMFMHKV